MDGGSVSCYDPPSSPVHTRYEITGRFEEPADCSALLYAPPSDALSFRRSRSYEFEFEGAVDRLTEFVRRCLLDEISQELSTGPEPWDGYAFALEFGMKPGALDLEKEAVLDYYRSLENPGFELKNLDFRHRIYVFGDAGAGASEQFERDIVNPAIHTWRVWEKSTRVC